ncbi:MAG TPA: hypothetical protein VFG20_16145 [Planctomycetaceae bacterium]|nr:hypothetical protein [Planctomycetaceae bacterium]
MKTPDDTAEPRHRPAWGLWVICVIVGSGLLLMWAAGRVKPLMVYPLAIGIIVGVWTRIVSAVCRIAHLRWRTLLPPVCAMAVTFGGLAISSQRQVDDIKPANPLAERLLRQFDEQTPTEVPAASTTSRFERLLQKRYQGTQTAMLTAWLIGELLIAAAACGGVLAFVPIRRSPETMPENSPEGPVAPHQG